MSSVVLRETIEALPTDAVILGSLNASDETVRLVVSHADIPAEAVEVAAIFTMERGRRRFVGWLPTPVRAWP